MRNTLVYLDRKRKQKENKKKNETVQRVRLLNEPLKLEALNSNELPIRGETKGVKKKGKKKGEQFTVRPQIDNRRACNAALNGVSGSLIT